MRGEETQLLGARHLDAALDDGKQLVCMPGTHTKWVSLHEGVVQEFLTAPTGELFAMLCEHSVLVRDKATPIAAPAGGFRARTRGVGQASGSARCCTGCSRAAACASTSSSRAEGAASWMSGLLIGSDVGGALALFPALPRASPVYVIGAPQLTESYSRALARTGARPCRSR